MMNEYMSRMELLHMVKTARAQWNALLAEIPAEWLSETGVEGEWSVKDIIAHISWGERENIGVVQARALVGSALWQLSEDERNAAVFAENRGRDLDDVLTESREVFQQYLEAIGALSEEELNEPARFQGLPDGWRPWRILYDPTHYQVHSRSILAWLERHKHVAS